MKLEDINEEMLLKIETRCKYAKGNCAGCGGRIAYSTKIIQFYQGAGYAPYCIAIKELRELFPNKIIKTPKTWDSESRERILKLKALREWGIEKKGD